MRQARAGAGRLEKVRFSRVEGRVRSELAAFSARQPFLAVGPFFFLWYIDVAIVLVV